MRSALDTREKEGGTSTTPGGQGALKAPEGHSREKDETGTARGRRDRNSTASILEERKNEKGRAG